ncbi:ATP-binding protein [Pedobacter sp. P351]|uniref:ATP-binding protein n=1 Tax=Pedobacter superstes TaxID=3133441 RepID=UPI0030954E2D
MLLNERSSLPYQKYLEGGGEMGMLTRSYDWSQSILGTPENWPTILLSTIRTILNAKFPMFLWWGPDLIQFYNDAYRPSLGNDGKHPTALGQKGEDCWPEIWPIIKPLIDSVLETGESTWAEDQLIPIYRNGRLEDVYWTFSYSQVMDQHGGASGVQVICHETTEKVKALIELKKAKEELERAKAETEAERDRLKRFFMQAPAPICILDGPEMIFELINQPYQQLFPGRNLSGKPVLEAMPEIKGTAIQDILNDVYKTGKTFEGNELHISLAKNDDGPIEDRYFNFIYQARHNSAKEVDGILVFVFEVTDMVLARAELQREKDKLKLAITAAEMGTFDMDLKKGTMDWDARCRTLFGISHNEPVTYEKDFVEGLHPEDRNRITEIINNSFIKLKSNGDYDVDYRTIGADGHQVRWVRAKGKVYFDNQDVPIRFTGSVLDITEQKLDEIRKNDFIGMVSHELKTPLTSLTAYVQMLMARAKRNDDIFAAEALLKANQQVKKMGTLINGFLNVSRFESGKIQLTKESFDVVELVKEVIEEKRLTFASHPITFHPSGSNFITADKDKIGSVISNFLSNAVKYSPAGKPIVVFCEKIGDNLHFSVKDEGRGIKASDLSRLFERFFRVQSRDNQYISGFGIGLYLSAEIVKRHDGQIWAESEPGKGSTFHFEIPVE